MKFCPYCGVSLPGDAASFCPVCGEPLPTGKHTAIRRRKKKHQRTSGHPSRQRRRAADPMDASYDGYYDDIQPIDAGTRGEGMDPELLKHVLLVILGAAGIMSAAIILMALL